MQKDDQDQGAGLAAGENNTGPSHTEAASTEVLTVAGLIQRLQLVRPENLDKPLRFVVRDGEIDVAAPLEAGPDGRVVFCLNDDLKINVIGSAKGDLLIFLRLTNDFHVTVRESAYAYGLAVNVDAGTVVSAKWEEVKPLAATEAATGVSSTTAASPALNTQSSNHVIHSPVSDLSSIDMEQAYICKKCGGTKPTCCSCPEPTLLAKWNSIRKAVASEHQFSDTELAAASLAVWHLAKMESGAQIAAVVAQSRHQNDAGANAAAGVTGQRPQSNEGAGK